MKRFLKLLFLCISILTVSLSCNKKPFDYRNQFTGEWKFESYYTSFMMGEDGFVIYDTIIYHGRIEYGKEKEDVIIYFTPDQSVQLKIEEDGDFYKFPTPYSSGNISGLHFENLDLFLRYGGLGGGSSYSVKGEKSD